MSNTRFNYDACRTKKQLQQSTGPGRYMLNVPGNGADPCYISDPQIIIQKWGGNLRTNTINLESDLRGVNRKAGKDCLGKDNYKSFNVPNESIDYPVCNNLYTEQSRAIMPAWTARDLEQVNWYYLPFNPQENTCISFQNNLSTRILEKDYFVRKNECQKMLDQVAELPTNENRRTAFYVGGPNICTTDNTCEPLRKL